MKPCHAGKHAIFIRFITENEEKNCLHIRKIVRKQFYECAKTICNVALLKNVFHKVALLKNLNMTRKNSESIFFLQNHIPYDTVARFRKVYLSIIYVKCTIKKCAHMRFTEFSLYYYNMLHICIHAIHVCNVYYIQDTL